MLNPYYQSWTDNYITPKDLPPPNINNVGVITFNPTLDYSTNINLIENYYSKLSTKANILLIPSFGVEKTIDYNTDWFNTQSWSRVKTFMKSNNIEILVTSVIDNNIEKSLALINNNGVIGYKLFDVITNNVSLVDSAIMDIKNARIGIVNSKDILIPEATMTLSKIGADIVLVPSHLDFSESFPLSYLSNFIETRSNDWVSIFSADSSGNGIMISNAGGYEDEEQILNESNPYKVMKIDVSKVRNKKLNSYYSFDQDSFMSNGTISDARKPVTQEIHSDAEVINPSVYCYIESQMVLTGGYAGFVSFNGVEQRQCETVDKQNCLIDTNFGFTHDKEIPLIINQQTYHIHYICDYN